EARERNSSRAKRCLGCGGIRNPQRYVVWLAQWLVGFRLKQRQLRAVRANVYERHGLRLMVNTQTQHVAKPYYCTRQITISNTNVVDALAFKECHHFLH